MWRKHGVFLARCDAKQILTGLYCGRIEALFLVWVKSKNHLLVEGELGQEGRQYSNCDEMLDEHWEEESGLKTQSYPVFQQ